MSCRLRRASEVNIEKVGQYKLRVYMALAGRMTFARALRLHTSPSITGPLMMYVREGPTVLHTNSNFKTGAERVVIREASAGRVMCLPCCSSETQFEAVDDIVLK